MCTFSLVGVKAQCNVCHHLAISNILLFSQQYTHSLSVCFSFALKKVIHDAQNNGKKSYNGNVKSQNLKV